jgi:hypothetical protein
LKRDEISVTAVAEALRGVFARFERMDKDRERATQDVADLTSAMIEVCRARLAQEPPESPTVQALGRVLQTVRHMGDVLRGPSLQRGTAELKERVALALRNIDEFTALDKPKPSAKPKSSPSKPSAKRRA